MSERTTVVSAEYSFGGQSVKVSTSTPTAGWRLEITDASGNTAALNTNTEWLLEIARVVTDAVKLSGAKVGP